MFVQFLTDSTETGPGFQATFTQLGLEAFGCDSNIEGVTQGEIYSPNYPGLYGNNEDCRYRITAAPGFGVSLEFLYFQVGCFKFHLCGNII